jgi:3-(3-hydroxy-phenyl)propionate hydroxylase
MPSKDLPSASRDYTAPAYTNGYQFSAGSGYELPTYPFVMPPELKGEQREEPYSIVIVGAGLAGLTLAASLASYGVKSVLLDDDNTVGVKGASSRGICYAQKTLEIFKRLGLYERIEAKGIQWSVGRTFAGHDEVYSFDLKAQSTHSLSTLPPFINIQQFYVEGFLVERVVQQGLTDLRWQHRVVGFEQNADFATLQLETPQCNYSLQARHVIDATGSKSPFRAWVGASLTSKKGDDRWCIADVRFKEQPPIERHTWIEAPFNDNRAVWQHLMADDVWRLDYQMAPGCDMQEVSRLDVVLERLQKQFAGKLDVRKDCEVVWVGPYAYKSEHLNELRHGRVFFVGDSAHVVSPFGARGGNSGVQDADNLAWKLAAVQLGKAGNALLDSYNTERHAAAVQNVQVTNRTARFLRPADGIEREFRNAALALAKRRAYLRPYVNTGRMSSPNTYPGSAVIVDEVGLSVANAPLRWADGSPGELIDLLCWAGADLLLLWFGEMDAEEAAGIARLTKKLPLRAVQVPAPDTRTQICESVYEQGSTSSLRQACGVTVSQTWALIRPDSYRIAAGSELRGISAAVQTALSSQAKAKVAA